MADKRKNGQGSEFGFDYNYAYDIDDAPKKDGSNSETVNTSRKTVRRIRNGSAPSVKVMIGVLFVLGLFLLLCLIFKSLNMVGILGRIFGNFLLGLFGLTSFAIPVLLFRGAIKYKDEYTKYQILSKTIYSATTLLFLSIILHTFYMLFSTKCVLNNPDTFFEGLKFFEGIAKLYTDGYSFIGGGFIGGFFAVLLVNLIGNAGTLILTFIFLAISLLFLFGATPSEIYERAKFYISRSSQRRVERRVREKQPKVEKVPKKESQSQKVVTKKEHDGTVVSIYGTKRLPQGSQPRPTTSQNTYQNSASQNSTMTNGYDADQRRKNLDTFDLYNTTEVELPSDAEQNRNTVIDDTVEMDTMETDVSSLTQSVDDYITNEESQMVEEPEEEPIAEEPPVKPVVKPVVVPPTPVAPPVVKKPTPKPPRYVFPLVELLQEPVRSNVNYEAELAENSRKIEKTFESFNIHCKVINVSRGPAVTRYEIAPEIGTKVSSITNRSEDLGLSLASQVLIEGVIPGKSAIGIQVPNKKTSTVYLRDLVDAPEFKNAKSKLTAALGIDITGQKVYCDVSKMPHLLIAGATGTGKSVTMNSIIASLLYKATPEDLKFIFIDPKKVEFSMYEGIPHLLVPVVTEPKKAAGALNWCVTEMERRYSLLEQTHKRKYDEYNEYCKEHPEAEKISQIVIIIDELADLMQTAGDAVESSIARIAAKARAAGMYLIIGTQRPSVDVITGTIKSNIPSRIACAVKGSIDSRTILDTTGAEQLVGRGDMLYAPVGSRSALRVQGAYVDESEIDKIVSFIKENNGAGGYNAEVADQIDRATSELDQKGKKSQSNGDSGADESEGNEDSAFDEAVKIAIEEKKISTSLLQRRLSLGYGRAAKLIDMMENRGIVSGPNGQKPRDVLITYEEYLEKKMRSDS